MIVSGANDKLSSADVEEAESLISSAAVVICQLEVPPKTTLAALTLAKKHGGVCMFLFRCALRFMALSPISDDHLQHCPWSEVSES